MKLRNKKTGEIREAEAREDGIYIKASWSDEEEWYRYDLETLASGWDYYVEPTEPKRYRLIKDLPTFHKGDEFFTDENGSLWLEQTIDGEPNTSRVMAYHGKTIVKFPNILEDWFEEIKPAEPLIKDPKIREAIRVWLAIQEQPIVEVAITCGKDSDGFFNYHLYGYIDFARMSNDKPVVNKNLTAIGFEFRSLEEIEFEMDKDYTITELCGEEE